MSDKSQLHAPGRSDFFSERIRLGTGMSLASFLLVLSFLTVSFFLLRTSDLFLLRNELVLLKPGFPHPVELLQRTRSRTPATSHRHRKYRDAGDTAPSARETAHSPRCLLWDMVLSSCLMPPVPQSCSPVTPPRLSPGPSGRTD